MSKFIRVGADILNLDYVIRAKYHCPKGERPYTEVVYLEGDVVLTTRALGDFDLEMHTAPVIPAEPGYSVVRLFDDDLPDACYGTPVIAWRIEGDYACPICPGDDSPSRSGSDRWGILHPNGKVVLPFDCTYNSLGDFIREESSRRQKALPPAYSMTSKATATYEQYRATGWTDAQLLEHGHMAKAAA
jgi:hypothetical protein